MSAPFKIGLGYDIHRFAPNRKCILGGVEIPHDKGLDGHSDADCLSHAVADAILGACGLPDIGHFFPNTDPSIKGIDSQEIVKKSMKEATDRGYTLGNLDIAVIAEEPKIYPHIDAMKQVLAASLNTSPENIGIKATTNEKIGDLGKGTGIAAHAVCLLMKV